MKISRQQFEAFCTADYNRVPATREILVDLDTPLSIYLKLADAPYSYLLESVKGGEKWGRYSFIGLPCHTIIRVLNQRLTVHAHGKLVTDIVTKDPLHWIENFHAQFSAPELSDLPRFNGGLVGYFGYDTVRYIEPKLARFDLPDPLQIPDILLMLSDEFIVFDTLLNKVHLVVYVDPKQPGAWQQAQERLDFWLQKFHAAVLSPQWLRPEHKLSPVADYTSNMTKAEYEAKVTEAIKYMVAGDAMQIALSQRLSKPFHTVPFNFYRALRTINPSPYMFYLNLEDFHIVGSSPEILARLEDNNVTLRPIAGTRPRGRTLQEDLALEKELLADPKELAEHLMLIDLGRNDVGRISQTGTVQVTEKMMIERYSHVMHIVSNVTGKLNPGLSAFDILKAVFPAGTLTGTPKIRAMEIVDKLETVKRGVYSGAVGYLGWNGNMDVAIAIRTAVIKDQAIHVQAGAGLVVDSVPNNEWQETHE